ncbi:MAG: hypothetical protein GWN62_16830 [Aliifodinibius sp.]|nr:hypothetical protein [Fodinibius sp.]
MKILEALKEKRLSNLASFEYAEQTFFVRQPQPEDFAEAFIQAKSAERIASGKLSSEMRQEKPDPTFKKLYGEAADAETLAMFGLDNPANLFEQKVGIKSLLAFTSYQFARLLMDNKGNAIASNETELNELARAIGEDKEFRELIAHALKSYEAQGETEGNAETT